MKTHLIALVLLLFVAAGGNAQEKLRFNSNGEFKIIQFTDTHVNIRKDQNLDIFDHLEKIIETEKPDLIMLTGDICAEDEKEEGYQFFLNVFEKKKLPWAVIFGNHEPKDSASREELALYLETLPYCLNVSDDGGIVGSSNYVLPVYGKSSKPEAVLYCMDSNSISEMKPRVDGYGWFDLSEIEWYENKSKSFTKENGGEPLPALAFFHIPLPEYALAWDDKAAVRFGDKKEKVCCPDINTGMFAAMVQCGDVMGTFVGHDHYNDYIVDYYNIALAYGRASKLNKQENPDLGGRVIVLKEGKHEFDTWIRDMHGEKVLECSYPNSFK